MRLKVMLVLALLAMVFSAFGVEVALLPLENFDTGPFPPPGWAQAPVFVATWDWHYRDDIWFGSDSCVNCDFNTPNDDSLFTPVFDASGIYDSIVIAFIEDYDTVLLGSGDAHILISTDSGQTWASAYDYGREPHLVENRRIRIDGIAGNQFARVCFWYNNSDDNHWAIDDVVIYGYTEPEPPVFTYTCEPVLPSGTVGYTFGVTIDDLTGVDPLTAEICYSLNGAPWTCDQLTYVTGAPDGLGDYQYYMPLSDWDMVEYFYRATDTYVPASTGSSAVCITQVYGRYYIYEDGTGYPMSPDTQWVDPTIGGTSMPGMGGAYLLSSPLYFKAVYYGIEYDSLWISSEGWVSLGTVDPGGFYPNPEFIPTAGGLMDNIFAFCWDDLTGANPYSEAWLSNDPNFRYMMLTFLNWRQGGWPLDYWSVQIQVWNPDTFPTPGGNCIVDVRFNKIPQGINNLEIGMENFDGTQGIAYLHEGGTYGDPSYLGLTSPNRTIRFCTVPPPDGIYGNVTLTGFPDNGNAKVWVEGHPDTVWTNAAGYYRMYAVPPGTYDVCCTHPSFFPETVYSVVVVGGDSTRVDFTLSPRPIAYVEGYADLTDTPGADAGILVFDLATGINCFTNATGYFFLDEVPPGDIQLMATFVGYNPANSPLLTVTFAETLGVDTLLLDPLPFFEDFELSNGGGVSTPGTMWEWGAPTYGPPGALSGINCWGTDLDADYDNTAPRPNGIYTLDIPITPSPTSQYLTYWQWYDMEEFGGVLYDGGDVWINDCGWVKVPDPVPAYTGVVDNSFGNPLANEDAYGLGPTGWELVTIDLTQFAGPTEIRFRFGNDGQPSVDAGWYIDNVAVHEALPSGVVEGYVYDCETYAVLEGARVDAPNGSDYTDANGYFCIPDVPAGPQPFATFRNSYFPGYDEFTVFIDETTTVMIPICPFEWDLLEGRLAYAEDDFITYELCNPTDDTLWFAIPPLPIWFDGDDRADGGIHIEVGPNPSDPNAPSREMDDRKRPSTPRALGDMWYVHDVSGECVNDAWGLGHTIDNFWVSDMNIGVSTVDYQYSVPTGAYTGVNWDVYGAGGSLWMADMAWDPNRGWLWQVAVGGTNELFAIDPATGAVMYTLSDPANVWTSTSQRGVGYDWDNDIFYIGGWNVGGIYKVLGPSWPNPGQIVDFYNAPGCAGVGWHPTRHTIWYAINDVVNDVAEIDPATNTIINVLNTPATTNYALAGLAIDNYGQIWVVDQDMALVYVLEGPVAGFYLNPRNGYIAPGDCQTFELHNDAYMTPVGDYCFDLYEAMFNYYIQLVGDLPPTPAPVCVQVQPREHKGWGLISVPVAATPNNPYTQLVDDVVPFTVGHPNSDLYKWNPYVDMFDVPTGFVRGEGYWLNVKHEGTYWEVYGNSYPEGTFIYPLRTSRAPSVGWWLIGNPFEHRIDWDDVVMATMENLWPGFDVDEIDVDTFMQNNVWVPETSWVWEDSIARYLAGASFWTYQQGFGFMNYSWLWKRLCDRMGWLYLTSSIIDPWEGYFVNVITEHDLIYPDIVGDPTTKASPKAASGPTADEFMLNIAVEAKAGADKRYDMGNYMAVLNSASDGADIYDIPEPTITPPGPVLNAWFEDGTSKLCYQTKQNFDEGTKNWTFVVRDLPAGMLVKLSWPTAGDLHSKWEITITDITTGNTVNMRDVASYSFTFGGTPRRFSITLSATSLDVDDEAKLPEEFMVTANNPNPFNATTAFAVAVPMESNVSVEVFDVLGHKITTLVDGELERGWHRIIWNGRDDSGNEVSSGVYLYRVVADKFRDTKKMILIK